jgi:hypothetical protein
MSSSPSLGLGRPWPSDRTCQATTFKTAWTTVRGDTAVFGRWHGNRHALVTELEESGAGGEAIVWVAGHVSRRMLNRHGHVRNEAKHKALEEIYARQRAAEAAAREKLEAQAQTQQHVATPANVAPMRPVQ